MAMAEANHYVHNVIQYIIETTITTQVRVIKNEMPASCLSMHATSTVEPE